MAPPTAQVSELELSVVTLQRREKRLRAILSSAFTSRESRLTAREELETVLDRTAAADDELQLLDCRKENPADCEADSRERVSLLRRPGAILKRRFRAK
jgi:predicted  nucleic acid-binding Zn-ribbon protein